MHVGSIISGGFRVVREHPGAVAVWGLLYLAVTVALALAIQPLVGASGPGGLDPEFGAGDTSSMLGRVLLFELALVIVMVVLFAASQRAVLRPERSGFAYLRLGMDELRLFGLTILLIILFYVGFLVAAIVLTLLVGVVAVAAGPSAALPLAFVQLLGLMALIIWFQVRLSLTFPLTLLRGRIVIGEAWRLSRNRFWTLLGAFLVIFLMFVALWIAVTLLTGGGYLADLARNGFNLEGIQAASERQMAQQFGGITVMGMIGWLLAAVAGTLFIAIFGGAVATAARELTVDVEGLADTFA
jgi:hypothetical protein